MNKLIEKAKRGDSESFIEAITLCTSELYKIGKAMSLNDEDIGDLIQETILVAYKKINTLMEQLNIDEDLNWETNIILDEKFSNSTKINYKWKDSEKIKVNNEETLPTGTIVEFFYYIKDKELLSGGYKIKLKTEEGKEYYMSGANLETNNDGYNYHILFDGLTTFENVNKFTLEFENNNSGAIDSVEFSK
ncbi:hypothetical protein NNC19_04185 [Clostridium sp. SHJSY1]|uniref:RNA polymerase sigma factor n=1 Tax=Clostridium sp. SHJSY1 TaxID=2942483 RepID=UPI0028758228|nr:hypothetical protein [Clostridium sp. SHJSY1]MDS0524867.1 hypothetical protein [Clostridium sp. SHJSY1]